ncbi:hypothetical protein N7510_000659 [Penicillium lagena]|uniref:uncharacterized protein n=1 Tax=Penicillium lagena TaxID=94218 RepID=UPI0025406595|nr:uncharacterized protein N7510_000659 [Penicillium lagena]KAJ5624350.1 hypothetical protein N7510_000659 [Penicillium lagena]
MDTTAWEKWARTTILIEIQWGTFFPFYTTSASIGPIYSVVAPLILIFNIVTFGLFWFVYRYNVLYVIKFRFDTIDLLFPRAINQLFTGLRPPPFRLGTHAKEGAGVPDGGGRTIAGHPPSAENQAAQTTTTQYAGAEHEPRLKLGIQRSEASG